MILDSKLMFSEAQTVPNGGDVDSTNVIDLGAAGKDAFGDAKFQAFKSINWFANISTTLVGAGALECRLVSASNAGLSADLVDIAKLNFATLAAAGTKKAAKAETASLQRYVGIIYTGGVLTAGAITSGLILGYNDSVIADK